MAITLVMFNLTDGRTRTDLILHRLLCLNMILLQLLGELLESLEVFNSNPHFLDFLLGANV